jgi:hypothetical protein
MNNIVLVIGPSKSPNTIVKYRLFGYRKLDAPLPSNEEIYNKVCHVYYKAVYLSASV